MSTVHGGPGNIVTNGLVLNLDAANPRSFPPPYNGTVWRDLSGNGNNGTLISGSSYNSANGGSIVFDGVDDYVGSFTNYNTYFNFLTNNQFTISCFFKANVNLTFNAMVVSGNSNGEWNYGLWISNTNTLFTGYHNVNKYGNTTLQQNRIYQGTLTYSGSIHTLYLNGNNDGVFTSTGLFNATNQSLSIGRKGVRNDNFFSGTIYSTQIYNRALSASEVLQNFNATRARFGI